MCYLLLNHEMHIYKNKKETKRVILNPGLVSLEDKGVFSNCMHLLLN